MFNFFLNRVHLFKLLTPADYVNLLMEQGVGGFPEILLAVIIPSAYERYITSNDATKEARISSAVSFLKSDYILATTKTS